MLILLSVLWGGSFFFVEVAVHDLPVLTIVFLRVSLAALALWAGLILLGRRLPAGWGVWRALLVMGLLNNLVPFVLITLGQTQIASGIAAILNATTPLFTVLVAHVWTADEKLSVAKILGVLIGFLGVAVMIGPEALGGLTSHIWGQIAALGAAVSYAFAGVYGRRLAKLGIQPVEASTGMLTVAAVLLLPLVLLIDRPWEIALPGVIVWSAIAGLALLSTSLAYILYFRILETAGATNLLLVTFLIPVSAILLGVLILGEALEGQHLVGLAGIGLGLAVLDGRLFRRQKS